MARAGETEAVDGWAGELAHLFHRLKATSGADPATGKQPSLRQVAARAGYAPSHVRDVLNGVGRPSPDAVAAVAGALRASEPDRRLAIFYAEQLQRSPSRPRARTPARVSRPVPRELPHDLRDFAGRDTELAQLAHYAAADVPAGTLLIAAVDGIGGVGKTALAVRFAHRIAGRFPDGQLHVNLRGFDPQLPPLDPHTVLEDLLRSLGIDPAQIPAGIDDRVRLYRSVIADRRVLLLLDNAATADQVRPLLPATNGCLALVTSRNRLSGLVARDGARRLAVDVLSPADSLSLLSATAGGERVRIDPDAAAQVARLAGHLPLALRIVGERLSSRSGLTARDLVGELTDERGRLDVFTAAGDEHLAVRAVFSLSYRRLPVSAARAFRLIGLHRGADISLEAVAALTAIGPDQVSPLLDDLSLASQYRGRYDEALVHSRRAAALWSRAGSQIGMAWNLHNLGTVHRQLGNLAESVDCCRQALRIRREIGDRPGEAAILHSLGKALLQDGQTEDAYEAWATAREIRASLGDRSAGAEQAVQDAGAEGQPVHRYPLVHPVEQ